MRNDIGRDRDDVGMYGATMGIEPVAMREFRTRDMDFPHAFKRELAQDTVDAGTSVSFVDPEIAEVEQNAGIRLVGDGGEKIAVVHFTEPRGEVVHAGFKRERQSDCRCSGLDVVNDQCDGGIGLQRRHEETTGTRP